MEVEEKRKLFKGQFFRRASKPVLDIVLPPAGPDNESMAAWDGLTYLDEPCCHSCGYPFEYDLGLKGGPDKDALCVKCLVDRPAFDAARSALQYHEESSALILSFKHGGRTKFLDAFARQMSRAGRRFWPHTDYIIPVPLHPSRLQKRKFNQAALLARRVAQHTNLPFDPDILLRHKATASQGSQTAKGRRRNVQGAFSIPESKRAAVKDKSFVIIDDVYTTGATLESCARTLRRAGAAQIFALTLARVVRDQEIPT